MSALFSLHTSCARACVKHTYGYVSIHVHTNLFQSYTHVYKFNVHVHSTQCHVSRGSHVLVCLGYQKYSLCVEL